MQNKLQATFSKKSALSEKNWVMNSGSEKKMQNKKMRDYFFDHRAQQF